MSQGHIAIVLNVKSGLGTASKAAESLQKIFAQAGREARITLATGGQETNAAMRRAVEGGCQVLVAGGGIAGIAAAVGLASWVLVAGTSLVGLHLVT